MEFADKCNNQSPESNRPPQVDPVRLDSQTYEFLIENNFAVFNDNGYLSLDDLIDDNPAFLEHSFETTVRKALGLVFNTTDLRKISTNKRRLRDNLLEHYETPQTIIKAMSSDHYLLLRIYTTLFKYRVKFYLKVGSDIRLQIFGDKAAPLKAKVLYDNNMFYLLTKSAPKTSVESAPGYERSPSPVPVWNSSRSASPCLTIRRLWEKLSNSDGGIWGSDYHQHFQLYEVSNSKKNRSQVSAPKLRPNNSHSKESGSIKSRRSVRLKNRPESLHSSSSSSPKYSKSLESLSWAQIRDTHDPAKAPDRELEETRLKGGVLVSYSASRQCGFILTDSGLEVLVAYDELICAGVPTPLLERSSDRVDKNVRFSLKLLCSEPVATFEAVGLEFTNFYLN